MKKTILSLSSLALIGTLSAQVEVPRAQIDGTETPIPEDLEYQNLAVVESLAEEENRPELPDNAVNLAAGKPVTTSDGVLGEEYVSYPEGDETIYLLTDSEKESYDLNEMVLLGDAQWVQIDLEASQDIHMIWLLHSHRQQRVFFDVIVQVSDDPNFEEGVTTLFNNDTDGSTGLGEGSDPLYRDANVGRFIGTGDEPVTARYVRFYSSGNSFEADTNLYIEAEVWGTEN